MGNLFFALIVDAKKGREVGNFDMPGSYLHAEIPKYKRILMSLGGDFTDIVCQVNRSLNSM